eukprot:g21885.t1
MSERGKKQLLPEWTTSFDTSLVSPLTIAPAFFQMEDEMEDEMDQNERKLDPNFIASARQWMIDKALTEGCGEPGCTSCDDMYLHIPPEAMNTMPLFPEARSCSLCTGNIEGWACVKLIRATRTAQETDHPPPPNLQRLRISNQETGAQGAEEAEDEAEAEEEEAEEEAEETQEDQRRSRRLKRKKERKEGKAARRSARTKKAKKWQE